MYHFFSGKPAIQAFPIIQIVYYIIILKSSIFFSNLLKYYICFWPGFNPSQLFYSEIPYKKLSTFTLLARSKMVYLVYVMFFFSIPLSFLL